MGATHHHPGVAGHTSATAAFRHAAALAFPQKGQISAADILAPPRDFLFLTLDGRDIVVGRRRWRVRVYSIADVDGFRWLQLSLDGQPAFTGTVRTSPDYSARHLLGALGAWLTDPSPQRDLLTIA